MECGNFPPNSTFASSRPAKNTRRFMRNSMKLAQGEKLTLVNDHDPRPLRFELDGDYPGRYAWEYLGKVPKRGESR